MYSDRDGKANEASQAAYDSRVRVLRLCTSAFSSTGFAAAVRAGELTMTFTWPKYDHHASKYHVLWPAILINSSILYSKNDCHALYRASITGGLLSLLLAYSLLPLNDVGNAATSLALLQFVCASILCLAYFLFPRRPIVFTPTGHPVDAEKSCSVLSHYSMSWCTAALDAANKATAVASLPALSYNNRASSQSIIVVPDEKPYIWRFLLRKRFGDFALQCGLVQARNLAMFCSPYCTMQLLRSLEDQIESPQSAWLWLLAIGACQVSKNALQARFMCSQWTEMTIPVRAQLVNSIFCKLLKRRNVAGADNTTGPGPDVVDVLSNDARILSRFAFTSSAIPSLAVKFFLSLLFLYRLLGWKSVVATTVAIVPCYWVHNFIAGQIRLAEKEARVAQVRTTAVLKEAFFALRQIKFSSLEAQWEAHIDTFRERELSSRRHALMTGSLNNAWDSTAPFIIAAISIYTYASAGGDLTPSIIFPTLSVLPILQDSIRQFPRFLANYHRATISASQIDAYLSSPERERILDKSPLGNIFLSNATITWPSDLPTNVKFDKAADQVFALQNLTMDFPAGELSLISGKTGSGKSLLLAAILGEASLHKGSISAPCAADGHPVAFVSQTPWLQSATIEENVLFGSPMNKERYGNVMAACALCTDVEALVDGDQTQIGPSGVKLSGGQRARVALARAYYSSATTIVLDDIFSALDAQVSKEILSGLTGELCHGRTRILVTHHTSLCLSESAYLVFLENNSAAYCGKPKDAPDSIKALAAKEPPSTPQQSSNEKSGVQVPSATSKTSLAVEPEPHHYDWGTYKDYFAAAGGSQFIGVYVFGLVAGELLDALTKYMLSRVKSANRNTYKAEQGTLSDPMKTLCYSMCKYLGSAALSVIVETFFKIQIGLASIRASRVLCRNMIYKVLRTPLLWMDGTPVGDLLKVFTADARRVDEEILPSGSTLTKHTVKLFTIVCVGLYGSRYTAAVAVILLVYCIRLSTRYSAAVRQLRAAEGGSVANILECVSTTNAGISTIRAFGAGDMFVERMHRLIDENSTQTRHSTLFSEWLGMQMSLVGTAFTIATVMFLLSPESAVDPGHVGFSLTFLLGLYRTMYNTIRQYTSLDRNADAISSVVKYTELKTEDLYGADVPADWPSAGQIEARSVELGYAPSLPPVLKSISFDTTAGQKVGIVGRTGAGKSSLALSLLRLLELRGGSICIDGIDISRMKLSYLRSRIAFVPQDVTLFSGTVRWNLDYFEQNPDDEINNALRQVGLLAEDSDTSSGRFNLQSRISTGGANMSYGQRQLLCLARILLRKPRIIILDEATSALDNETDSLVQEAIQAHFTGTLVVVAHRLQTIATFDKIIVLRDGEVVEQGTPRGLLVRQGAFYEFVQKSQDVEALKKLILKD